MSASTLLFAAGALLFVVGAVHTVGGEIVVFRHLDRMQGFPTFVSEGFWKRTVRATWHVATVLAFGVGWVFVQSACEPHLGRGERFALETLDAAVIVSGVVILVVTRARHPGWVAVLASGVLAALALYRGG